MTGYNLNENTNSSRDCSPFSSSGMLNMQAGSANMNGPWDSTVEGAPGFPEYHQSYAGAGVPAQDPEDYSFRFGHEMNAAHKDHHMSGLEDYQHPHQHQQKWTVASSVNSVPMQRNESRKSTGSYHSHSHTLRQMPQKPHLALSNAYPAIAMSATMSSASSNMNNGYYPVSPVTTAVATTEGGSMIDYINMDMGMCTSLVPTTAYGPDGLVGGYGHSLGHATGPQVPQHVDPSCTLNFDNLASSPQTFGSPESSRSSPLSMNEESWSQPGSPTGSAGSTSALSYTHNDQDGHMAPALGDEYAMASNAFPQRSPSDSETARDHPYYKDATIKEDGLYHCPWEGQPSCSHKPEKLKCNYDKFVDSHLKPYRCRNSACENARFSSTACLLRHEREAHAMHGHGDKPFRCTYVGCERAQPGSGFPRLWNLKDHMRRVHQDETGPQLSSSVGSTGSSFSHSHGMGSSGRAAAAVAMAAAASANGSSSSSSNSNRSRSSSGSSSQSISKGRKRKKEAEPVPSRKSSASSSSKSPRGVQKRASSSGAATASASISSISSISAGASANASTGNAASAASASTFAASASLSKLESAHYQHKSALSSIVMNLSMTSDQQLQHQQLKKAQEHLAAIQHLYTEIPKATVMQEGYQRYPPLSS